MGVDKHVSESTLSVMILPLMSVGIYSKQKFALEKPVLSF